MDIKAWLSQHGKAVGVTAAAVVAAFALYRHHENSVAAAAAGTSGAGAAAVTAGLAPPDTQLTDIQNAVQDQVDSNLNAFQSSQQQQFSTLQNEVGQYAAGITTADKVTAELKSLTGQVKALAARKPTTITRIVHEPAPRPKPRPAPARPKPAPRRRYVTVQRGDTLWGIARDHGISLHSLEGANRQIRDFNLIYPGQHVNLP